jgi:hypothetical protein
MMRNVIQVIGACLIISLAIPGPAWTETWWVAWSTQSTVTPDNPDTFPRAWDWRLDGKLEPFASKRVCDEATRKNIGEVAQLMRESSAGAGKISVEVGPDGLSLMKRLERHGTPMRIYVQYKCLPLGVDPR